MTDMELYLEYWRELDMLWKAGLGESIEAELLRDRMDEPWYRMTPMEIMEVRRVCNESS